MAVTTGTALLASAGVGLASSYLSGKEEASAARKGMAAEERMAANNLDFQKEQAETQLADFAPWREAGEEALGKIQSGIESGAFSMDNFQYKADPGYQFRLDQGIKALDASAASRGRLLSGAQQQGVNAYAQGMASQEYGNAYNREQNNKTRKYNMLSSLNQGGQASAAGQAQVSGQLAQTGGNIMANLGRSQNIAQQNIGAARAGAYQGAAQSLNQAGQNWMLHNALKGT